MAVPPLAGSLPPAEPGECDDLVRADHYDSFALSCARANESGLFNRYYARPAMIELAGDVQGRRVLDAGCGSGP